MPQKAAEIIIAERIAELPTESDRKALIEANKHIPSPVMIRALVGQVGTKVINEPFIAIRLLESALDLSVSANDEAHLKSILPNLGLAYRQARDYRRSSEYFQRALDYFTRLDSEDMMYRVNMDLGINFVLTGDYQSATSPIAARVAYLEKVKNKRGLLDAFVNLAAYYRSAGDHFHQLAYLVKAQAVIDDLAKNDPAALTSDRIASVFNSLGNAYRALGDTERAIVYFRQSLKVGPPGSSSTPLQNLGDVYLSLSDYSTARVYFDRSLRAFQDVKYRGGQALALEKIGDSYAEEKEFDKALEWHQKALALRMETASPSQMNRLKIGRNHLKLGNLDEAFAAAEAIASDPKNASYPDVLIVSNILAGRALRARGDDLASSKFFDAAFAVAENENKQYTGYGFGPAPNIRSPYYEKVLVEFRRKQYREAFRSAEKDKARALLSVLVGGKMDVYGAMSKEDQQTEKRLRQDLVSLNGQLAYLSNRPRPDTIRLAELNETLRQSQARFQAFQKYINKSYPNLAVQRAQMDPIGFEDAAELLPNQRSVFIEFVVADDRLVLFLLGKDAADQPELKAVELLIEPTLLTERIRQLREKLASGDLGFQQTSMELYDLLLKPMESELRGKSNIVIVPDGPLWDLPFQALMDQQGKYLIEKAAVSYAPSLTALREMVKKAKAKKPAAYAELIAFGNPIIGEGTKARVQQVFMNERLEPLPEAERLVNTLGKMYGPKKAKIYTGVDAREQTAKTETPKYRIVQFAAHGILNSASPMYSHIVLSQKQDDPNEDGLLEAWELKDLDLNAEMVILSACDTARGRIANGEGVIGMTWASFIAGAPTTVATQWSVTSSSTTDLMIEFHRQLLTGKVSKAEALRRASLKLMKIPKYRHPLYWAGFVMVGDGS